MRSAFVVVSLVAALAAAGCSRSRSQSGSETCTPGRPITVACSEDCGIGACSGDPVLRVCEGSISVEDCLEAPTFLGQNDDDRVCATSGLCSRVDTLCPSSGRVTVALRAFGSGPYQCAWELVEE